MPTFFITTAIDYPNAKPHIGHAYEKIIADALARWHRLLGEDVFFLTGTDEHGQKIEKAAKAAGKTPQQFVDDMVVHFKELCSKLNINYSKFIRTTDPDHVTVAQSVFKKVFDKGDIYLGTYEGLYCTGCEAFYLEKDAPNNECPVHKRALEYLKEPSYFFKMSKYQNEIIKYIQSTNFIQPEFRKNEILNRLKEGLRDLSVSRTSFSWGIQLPNDAKHVIYVWFDALLNYISGIGYPGPQYKKYWPAVHIIGKDIAWFHTVIWPAILLAADIPLPKVVHTHGFINIGGEKLSKTRGIVVDPIKLVSDYGTDAVRYFFLREIPAGQDGDFSEEALVARNNADLADTLGNLLQRTSVLIQKNFNSQIPALGALTPADEELVKQGAIVQEIDKLLQKFEWHRALERLWEFIKYCNKYVNEQEPWNLAKHSLATNLTTQSVGQVVKDKERVGTVLYCLVESLRVISILVYPFIPTAAEQIACQLGQQKPTSLKDAVFKKTTTGTLLKPQILFKKLEVVKHADHFALLNLRVGVVKDVKQHPNADKLYVLQVDLGAEQRQLCAGIKQWYAPEELTGKHVVVVSNLKPAKLRGVESQGMMLAAEKEGVVRVLEAPNTPAGSPVTINGISQGTAQITIDEFAKVTLTTKDKKAVYNEQALRTEKEEVVVDIGDSAVIQ